MKKSDFRLEMALIREGYDFVIGVDEAGEDHWPDQLWRRQFVCETLSCPALLQKGWTSSP